MPTPTSHSYFSQRLRLHYLNWQGSGSQPLMLIHGLQDHCHTWDRLAAELCVDHHVIAPDLRGHGDSSWIQGGGYSYLDYLYDLDQLVRQAKLEPVTLVAHSMGGTLALLYAGIYPERVARVVAIEAIGLWQPEAEDAAPEIPAAPAIHAQIGAQIDATIAEWMTGNRELAAYQPRRYDTVEEACARMRSANPNLTAELAYHLTVHGANQNEDGTFCWKFDPYTRAFPVFNMPPEHLISLWQRIRCPVLLLNASNGYAHRAGQNGTLTHFANAQLEQIDDAGHWTYHDQHEAVSEKITAFLGSKTILAT